MRAVFSALLLIASASSHRLDDDSSKHRLEAALNARAPPGAPSPYSWAPKRAYCQRSNATCWPTTADVSALTAKLDPAAPRVIHYAGGNATKPAPVPSGAEQPLFGFGEKGMPPVVVADGATGPCFAGASPADETRPACLAATRDNPAQWGPAFVVFPLTAAHVVQAVLFARRHNLCVSVLGTGHDFVNRHDGCPDGLLIRTTLLKSIAFDLADARGFGWAGGSARLGSGLTFSEVARAASDRGRIVASGWTHSVGVAGWSLGGGHGPFAGWAGLGVDNVLEVELVSANGTLLVANASSHADLFAALRGGGGSTWGVVTAFTLRVHALPEGGFHQRMATWTGDNCKAGAAHLSALVDAQLAWSLALNTSYNGLVWVLPTATKTRLTCGAEWLFSATYVVRGAPAGSAATWARLLQAAGKKPLSNTATSYARQDAWTAPLVIPIQVTPWMAPGNATGNATTLGGVPSVAVGREQVESGALGAVIKRTVAECDGTAADPAASECQEIQMYQDITGNLGAVQPADVSISPGFRSALYHVISSLGGWTQAQFDAWYALGEGSYFSESAIVMAGFQQRYWGANYGRLLRTKQAYDPDNFLWCRNCVGSDL
eukprot:g4152.t1